MRLTSFLFLQLILILPGFAQNLTGWTLIWADEFTQANGSSPDSTKWAYETGAGGWGNNELEYYTSRTNNIRIENNQLVIEAKQENYMGSSYTSARVKTQGKASWTYVRIEARIKIPRSQGIWPAFWTLGTNINSVGWPACGEIDIMENIGKEPTLVHGTIHGPGYSGGDGIGGACPLPGPGIYSDDFHIYAMEWTTNQIKWFMDGQQYFGVNPASLPPGSPWAFTNPQFILLNVAVGGLWPGYPDGTTILPQRMVVDYVRVYAPTNLPSCGSGMLTNPGFESGGLANWTTYGANNLLESIRYWPVHDGSNVYKVYGQFSGSENFTGIYQDRPASPGQTFTASGWAFTPSNDKIAGANSAWIEVSFRNASANTLAAYRTALITTDSPGSIWMKLAVTNQLDITNSSVIGSVTNLVAPSNTSFVRYQVVFRQPANAAGAVLFDDLKLTDAAPAEFLVSTSFTKAGNNLNLNFPTYLGLPYEVRSTDDATETQWQSVTTLAGNGTNQTIGIGIQPTTSAFFRVVRLCN